MKKKTKMAIVGAALGAVAYYFYVKSKPPGA
jgi:hypothetical protein